MRLHGKGWAFMAAVAVVVGVTSTAPHSPVACADEPNESASSECATETKTVVTNKLGANKLATNRLAHNKLTTDKLALNTLATNDLMATADGRQVLEYLISCAVPEGTTLVTDFEGVSYEFPGALGLAPKWVDRPLKKTERGWISACMIARVNLYAHAVAVSLRGPHEALTVDQAEAEFYTVQEGAFYGDIFSDPIIWIACRGEGQALGEFGQLDDRDCAEEDGGNPGLTRCGFRYAGDCRDFTPETPSPYACKKFVPVDDDDVTEGGYYKKCYDEPVAGQKEKGSATRYKQVITVFVHP